MSDVTPCPECGADSKHQHTRNFWNDRIIHVRTCRSCPTEWTVEYADPVITDVKTHEM